MGRKIAKKKIFIFFGIVVLAVLFSFLPYCLGRIHTVDGSSLNAREYDAICGEYGLDPERAVIDRIFSAREIFGVRLIVDETDLEDLNVILSEKYLSEEDSNYDTVSGRDGQGSFRALSESRSTVAAETVNAVKIGGGIVYCKNGVYYMEFIRSMTNNMEIYSKK